MRQGKGWLERLSDGADLPGLPLPGVPLVELAGDRRVLIENHGGVTEYGSCRIQVQVRYGQIAVCGRDLQLARMTREQLVISGKIDSVTLCRRGE